LKRVICLPIARVTAPLLVKVFHFSHLQILQCCLSHGSTGAA
jgi:hypothetical protein